MNETKKKTEMSECDRDRGDATEARFSDGIKKKKKKEQQGDEQKNNGQRQSLLWPLQPSDPAEIPFIRL